MRPAAKRTAVRRALMLSECEASRQTYGATCRPASFPIDFAIQGIILHKDIADIVFETKERFSCVDVGHIAVAARADERKIRRTKIDYHIFQCFR